MSLTWIKSSRCATGSCVEVAFVPEWIKSSGCTTGSCVEVAFGAPWTRSASCTGGTCVEAQIGADQVVVRDKEGRTVEYDADEWDAFIEGVKRGEFDRPGGA